MVGSCDVKFPIRLEGLVLTHGNFSSYEPELFPGLIYRMVKPRIVLLIFVSGKVVLTGAKVRDEIYEAFETIFPILKGFKKHWVSYCLLCLRPSLIYKYLKKILIQIKKGFYLYFFLVLFSFVILDTFGHEGSQIIELNLLCNVLGLDGVILSGDRYRLSGNLPVVLLCPNIEGFICKRQSLFQMRIFQNIQKTK